MKFQIENAAAGLKICIDDVAGQELAIIERIRRCRQSAWACPSGECMKIGTMEDEAGEGRVLLTLTSRPGEELSATGIEQCLRYMLYPVAKKTQ